jgi:glucose/arabinose dehydrogenase
MLRRSFLLPFALATGFSWAQSPVAVQLESFATGLGGMVDIVHAGDERLFVVLQPGVIRIVQPNGSVLPNPFLNIQARVNDAGNEQGLLGLAFDPAYAENGRFYVCYTAGTGNGTSRVSRFTVTDDANIADPDSEEILYTWPQPFTNHNGGDLDFGPDGMLYIGLGDGGSGNDPQGNAQDLTDPLGDMLRIDVSGETGYTVPTDNPFIGVSTALPEIWALGLRNPWRFGFDALTGDMWIGDVGENAYEEVDFWPAGNNSGPNFGWRCREGAVATPGVSQTGCLAASQYVAPAISINQNTQSWCSVIGGRVYRGEQFYRLEGAYIYTDYCGGQFYTLRPNGSGGWTALQVRSTSVFGFTCIGEDSSLEMYAGNASNGILYRIVDVCDQAQPTIIEANGALVASDANSYQWYLNGQLIPGAVEQTYVPVQNGSYYVVANLGTGCLLASGTVDYISTSLSALEGSNIQVMPIPANTSISVRGELLNVTGVRMMDATGRIVLDHSVAQREGIVEVDVRSLPDGVYHMALYNSAGDPLLNRSVVVQH